MVYSSDGDDAIGGLSSGYTYYVIKDVTLSFDSSKIDTSNDPNTIDIGDNGWQTGDQVQYKGSGISGLTDGTTYSVIVSSTDPHKIELASTDAPDTAISLGTVDQSASGTLTKEAGTNEVQLARSAYDASVGKAITLTSEGTSSKQSLTDAGSASTIQLAQSADDARNRTAIDLTSKGSGTQYIVDQTHDFSTTAVSGAGAPDVGVAGSAAINWVTTTTEAYVATGSSVAAGGKDVTLNAENTVISYGLATSKGEASGDKGDGIGLSFGLTIASNTTRAEIDQDAALTGAGNLALSATTTPTITTKAEAGASGNSFSLGGAVSIADISTATKARIAPTPTLTSSNSVGATTDLNGAMSVTASEVDGTTTTSADGTTSGKNVGIGVAVAINLAKDEADATIERVIDNTGSGVSTVTAQAISASDTTAKASVKGEQASSDSSKNADSQAGQERSFADTEATDAGSDDSESSDSTPSMSTSDGPVGIAAAIALDISDVNSTAAVLASFTSANGSLSIHSSANGDGLTEADGSAAIKAAPKSGSGNGSDNGTSTGSGDDSQGSSDDSGSDSGSTDSGSGVGVGVGVAVNDAHVNNNAYIDGSATVSTKGLSVVADMAERDKRTFNASNAVDTTNDTVNIGNNQWNTGDEVVYDNGGGSSIGGLTSGSTYYVIAGQQKQFDPSQAVDTTADTINVGTNTWKTGDAVVYSDGGGTAIGGLGDGDTYYVIDYSKTFGSSEVDKDADTITVGANNWKTGDAVVYSSGGGTAIGGLTDGTTYYVIVDSSDNTKVQLATSKDNATSGTAIDLTDQGSGTKQSLTDPTKVQLAASKGGTAIDFTDTGSGTNQTLTDADSKQTIRLAASQADAENRKAIDLTSAGSGTQSFVDETDEFSAKATSGAGVGKVGVAGSVAINIAGATTSATINYGGHNSIADNGDLILDAGSTTQETASAKPVGDGANGSSVGVGASVAVSVISNSTTAQIADGLPISGTVGNFKVDAIGSHTITTETDAGASGGDAIGASVAVAVIHNTTIANTGNGDGSTISASGTGDIEATLSATETTKGRSRCSGQQRCRGRVGGRGRRR